MVTDSHKPAASGGFVQATAAAMSRLRLALGELIEAIPQPINKAADVHRALGVDPKLGWQVFKVVNAVNTAGAGVNVPKRVSMQRLLKAAAGCGVPAHVIDHTAAAFDEFENLVTEHAGDRASFESMVSAVGDQDDCAQIDLNHRKAAFRSNSHIWGVQATARLACFIYQPSPSHPGQQDLGGIRGFVGLRRLRREGSWVVTQTKMTDADGTDREAPNREALDPSAEVAHGVSLLEKFCSQPLPRFRAVPGKLGYVNTELEGDSVGNQSATTCMIGDVWRGVFGYYRDERNKHSLSHALVHTPCKVLIHDVLVREGMYGSSIPEVLIYGDHRGVDPHPEGRDCDLLAMHASVSHLGKGPLVVHTPDVPRYVQMLEYAFDRLGWDGEKFDVYRCRVEYPVMPSSVVVRFDLPEKP